MHVFRDAVMSRQRLEAELEVAEIEMWSFSLVETRMDRIRSESIMWRGTEPHVLEMKPQRPD